VAVAGLLPVQVGCLLVSPTSSPSSFDNGRSYLVKAAHSVGVSVRIKEVSIEDRPVVFVGVDEVRGRFVTTPDGRLLRRVGSDNQPLVGDALQRFVLERAHVSAEERPFALFDPEEFDLGLINQAPGALRSPSWGVAGSEPAAGR